MLIRFWGTRGSIPVALTGAGVRSKIKQALLQANGRCFDDDAAVERFIDEELDFPIRHSYGGNTACVDIVGGTEYMVCDMGSGLRSLGQQIMREHGPGQPQVYNWTLASFAVLRRLTQKALQYWIIVTQLSRLLTGRRE
jgi:hypothetical protein